MKKAMTVSKAPEIQVLSTLMVLNVEKLHRNAHIAGVKDVGGNPKDPLIWISAYMIYMAYTYQGRVYMGKEAPS